MFRKNREVRATVITETSTKALSESMTCTTALTSKCQENMEAPIKIADRLSKVNNGGGMRKRKVVKINRGSCHSTGLPYIKGDKKVKGLEVI